MPDAALAADAIRTRGFTVVENALGAREVAELTAGIERVMRELAVPFGANEFLGLRTRAYSTCSRATRSSSGCPFTRRSCRSSSARSIASACCRR